MAAHSAQIEGLFTCMIHYGALEDPKLLQCGHSFCLTCLEKYVKCQVRDDSDESTETAHLTCPICEKMTLLSGNDLKGLPNNYTFEEAQRTLKDIQKQRAEIPRDGFAVLEGNGFGKMCNFCERDYEIEFEAEHYCYLCAKYLCVSCFNRHQQISAFDGHTTFNVKSMFINALFCPVHNKENVRHWCEDCKKALCPICANNHSAEHSIHNLIDRDKEVEEKHQLSFLKNAIDDCHEQAKCHTIELNKVKKTVDNVYAALELEIRQWSQKAMEAIISQTEALEKARIEQKEAIWKELMITQEDLNFFMSCCKSVVAFSDKLLSTPTIHPLGLYKDLNARMATLTKSVPKITQHKTIQLSRFSPQYPNTLSSLGKLESYTHQTKIPNEDIDDDNIETPDESPKQEDVEDWIIITCDEPREDKDSQGDSSTESPSVVKGDGEGRESLTDSTESSSDPSTSASTSPVHCRKTGPSKINFSRLLSFNFGARKASSPTSSDSGINNSLMEKSNMENGAKMQVDSEIRDGNEMHSCSARDVEHRIKKERDESAWNFSNETKRFPSAISSIIGVIHSQLDTSSKENASKIQAGEETLGTRNDTPSRNTREVEYPAVNEHEEPALNGSAIQNCLASFQRSLSKERDCSKDNEGAKFQTDCPNSCGETAGNISCESLYAKTQNTSSTSNSNSGNTEFDSEIKNGENTSNLQKSSTNSLVQDLLVQSNQLKALCYPTDLTFLSSDLVLTTDCRNETMHLFNIKGKCVRPRWCQRGLICPWGIICATNGQVYATDIKSKSVCVLSPKGEVISKWGSEFFQYPTGIDVTKDGKVIVADAQAQRISIHETNGTQLFEFKLNPQENEESVIPAYISVTPQNHIGVLDLNNSCVKVYNMEGEYLFKISNKNHQFCKFAKVNGGLEHVKCHHDCRVIYKNGKKSRYNKVKPAGICSDSNGNYFISDSQNGTVLLYNSKGEFTQYITDLGSLKCPKAIALNNSELLAAAECLIEKGASVPKYGYVIKPLKRVQKDDDSN